MKLIQNDGLIRTALIKKGLLGACIQREHTGKTAKKREKERNARALAKQQEKQK